MRGKGRTKSAPPVTADSFHLLNNRHNFEKSGRPARVMFYCNREWTDFGGRALDAMCQGFAAHHPAVEVDIGGTRYLIDFLRMMQIDLTRGIQRSIAWIDEAGKCFFPKLVTGSDEGGALLGPIRRRPGRPPKVPKLDSFITTYIYPQNPKVADEAGPSSPPDPQPVVDNSNSTGSLPAAPARSETPPAAIAARPDTPPAAITARPDTPPVQAARSDTPPFQAARPDTPPVQAARPETPADAAARVETSTANAKRKGKAVKMDGDDHDRQSAAEKRAPEESGDESRGAVNKRVRLTEPGGSSNPAPNRFPSPPHLGPPPGFEHLDTMRLVRLSEHSGSYQVVANMFQKGMKNVDPCTAITGIRWIAHAGLRGSARLRAFHRFAEMTTNIRGDANVRHGWFGTDPISLERIVLHGFREVDTHGFTNSYGTGVYLSAESFSHYSAALSTPDSKGDFHVLLCRLAMGNMEQIKQGSQQFRPSSALFDSGVDDFKDPRCYIIWSTHMNTHILPEYVISFKVYEHLADTWRRKNILRTQLIATAAMRAPTAASHLRNALQEGFPWLFDLYPEPNPNSNLSFPILFNELRRHLPSCSIEMLEGIFAEVKTGNISKETLVNTLRGLVGDDVLKAVINGIRDKSL
ncbi:probable inactive poly [ADP-ribose] polymerase SRO1 [Aristolochia californica]|uniref:probable inactive poly [ADP-ribose] polymerase SRO1 n=1 Tax=Aristolochia californica TaxID=171875 RepID=UPI0035DE73CA